MTIASAEGSAAATIGSCDGRRPPVYVIDDDSDSRKSLHFLLSTSNLVAWPFAAAEDFFDHLPSLVPGPILLDIRMPSMDGLQTLTKLLQQEIAWPVIIMTAHGDIAIAVRAMKLGAIEFLEKPFRPEMLDSALAQAFEVLTQRSSLAFRQHQARALLQKLSQREREVVALLVEGLPNKTVAFRLGLSARTVEMHRRNALAKLGLKSIAETVALVVCANLPTIFASRASPELIAA